MFVFFLGQRIILFTFLYRSISFDVDHFFFKAFIEFVTILLLFYVLFFFLS